jgi:hypothetical protein
MPDHKMQRNACPHAVSKQIGLSQSQLPDGFGNVICHALKSKRAIDIRGPPVGLQLKGDDLAAAGKQWYEFSKRCADP